MAREAASGVRSVAGGEVGHVCSLSWPGPPGGHLGHLGGTNLVALLSHSIPGLVRLGLLENEYHFGPNDRPDQAPYEFTLRVQPSVPGLELYAWAAGESDVLPKDFGARHLTIETDSALRRLVDVALPRLIPVTAPEAGAAVEG